MVKRSEREQKLRRYSFPDAHELLERGTHPSQVLSRKERRTSLKKTKKVVQNALVTRQKIIASGAGYPIDSQIRDFADEYNERSMTHGTRTLPVSFTYLEPFLRPEMNQGYIPLFNIREESDHLFSMDDYLDYITSSDAPKNYLQTINAFPEETIFNYTPTGNIEDLSYIYNDSRKFSFAGFSMIRHDSEINWILLGGELISSKQVDELTNITLPIKPTKNSYKKHFNKKFENISSSSQDLEILEGTTNVWKHILFGRFDAASGKHLTRAVYREFSNGFTVFYDDPHQLEVDKLSDDARDEMLKEIDNMGVLFDLSHSLLSLDDYFKFKFTAIRESTIITGSRRDGRKLISKKKSRLTHEKTFKTVTSLEILDTNKSPIIRKYSPPKYQVEVNGFWRKLSKPDKKGVGPDGQSTMGRTWVKGHLRWRDRAQQPKTIYVKSSVRLARAKAAAITTSSNNIPNMGFYRQEDPPEVNLSSTGCLYVMRCPIMEDDVYKVGFTSRDPKQRAEELSKATGVPMAYIVVEHWPNSDARDLEKRAHIALSEFRIQTGREFFKAEYETIRKRIINVLETK